MFEDEIPLGKAKDLRGKKFGYLTALYRIKNKGHNTYWKCKCDCGNIIEVAADHLTRGNIISCGCYSINRMKNLNKKDLTGMRFGKLIAIEPTDKREHHSIVWKCKCDCGNITEANTEHLMRGAVQSCGCLLSKGEETINKILSQNNIIFETQKTFDTCRGESKRLLRFDFFINNQYLLEYDGSQHFDYTGNGWNTKEQYEELKKCNG